MKWYHPTDVGGADIRRGWYQMAAICTFDVFCCLFYLEILSVIANIGIQEENLLLVK